MDSAKKADRLADSYRSKMKMAYREISVNNEAISQAKRDITKLEREVQQEMKAKPK